MYIRECTDTHSHTHSCMHKHTYSPTQAHMHKHTHTQCGATEVRIGTASVGGRKRDG